MLRLAHRILDHRKPVPLVILREIERPQLVHAIDASLKKTIEQSTILVLDDAAEVFYRSYMSVMDDKPPDVLSDGREVPYYKSSLLPKDMPSVCPPWGTFFLEWNVPEDLQASMCMKQAGALVFAYDMKNPNDEGDFLLKAFGSRVHERCLDDEDRESVRWMLGIVQLWTHEKGFPVCTYVSDIRYVRNDGRLLGYFAPIDLLSSLGKNLKVIGESNSVFLLYPGFFGLSLLNCHNVEAVDATDTVGPSIRWTRRAKLPRLEYKVLNVHSVRSPSGKAGTGEKQPDKALHVCRGHYRTYTDDSKLFGKLTGTFWIPQHIRGSSESGEVHKDYRLLN